jgi:hypothetical protein
MGWEDEDGLRDEDRLKDEDCKNFPCEELKIIDDLWVKYSNGKFGFSVQKKIWIACGGIPGEFNYNEYLKFADTVGWRKFGNWLSYSDITFNINVPYNGHLPARWMLTKRGLKEFWFLGGIGKEWIFRLV